MTDSSTFDREQLLQWLAPWRQVVSRADAFFAQALANHGPHFRCAPGCASCCHPDLSVLLPEALAILLGLEDLEQARREELRRHGASPAAACPLLAHGLCQVYELRPLVCRTHGLPIWLPDEPDTALKLEEVSCCPLNFSDAEPPPGVILNGTLLNAGLTVADAMLRKELSLHAPRRFSLRELVHQGWAALEGATP